MQVKLGSDGTPDGMSGGELQRMGIARALLRKTPILLIGNLMLLISICVRC